MPEVSGEPQANTLHVGEGVTIKGAVLTSETVIVDGVLDGDVSVGNLIVRKTGTIKGRVVVTGNAEIFGKVLERLDVSGLLILRAASRVEGTVSCGLLSIEQGASIIGGISPTQGALQPSYRPDAKPAARSVNGSAAAGRLDLSALDSANPFAEGL